MPYVKYINGEWKLTEPEKFVALRNDKKYQVYKDLESAQSFISEGGTIFRLTYHKHNDETLPQSEVWERR